MEDPTILITGYQLISVLMAGMFFYVIIKTLDDYLFKAIKWIYLKIKGLFKKNKKENNICGN